MKFTCFLVPAILAAGLFAAPAEAVPVTLSGSVTNSCTLTVTTSGTMALSSDGTVLGSAQSGGSAATLSVSAAGSTPTLTFAAPSVASGASTSGATTEIAYTSLSGANQAYTSSQTSHTASLIDTFTVHGRVTRAAGFGSGTYTVTTLVTCAQP